MRMQCYRAMFQHTNGKVIFVLMAIVFNEDNNVIRTFILRYTAIREIKGKSVGVDYTTQIDCSNYQKLDKSQTLIFLFL